MRRLPKKRDDAEVLLALSVVGLDPDGFLNEAEVNAHLMAWLDIISTEDYVSLRRSLVDAGFLRRASDGFVYRVRPERINEVLAPTARTVDAKQVFAEVESVRNKRKETRSSLRC